MRSWGSTPVNGSPAPEFQQAPVVPVSNGTAVVDDGEKKKKKKKKGDKGGTGSKANSSAKKPNGDAPSTSAAPTVITTPVEEPSQKKRKRDPSPAPAPAPAAAAAATTTNTTTPSGQPSEKILKRLRKNISKLDSDSSPTPASLGEWLDKVGKGKKDESMSREEVLASLKVGQVDGKWVLEVPAPA